jgi:hypothetical protein
MHERAWLLMCWVLMLSACPGGSGAATPSTRAGDAGSAACPQLAGIWTIAKHCGSSLIGSQITITQTGCSVTTNGAFPGFTGRVEDDGSFELSGTSQGTSVSCTGTAGPHQISEQCTGDCAVTLTR